jgi:hypothetical protein
LLTAFVTRLIFVVSLTATFCSLLIMLLKLE